MGFRIREIEAEGKFSRSVTMEAIGEVVDRDTVEKVLEVEQIRERRERKLNMVLVVWVLIAMSLYSARSIGRVVRKVAQGVRFLWPDPHYALPGDSAISYRRRQLGARPLVALFHTICRPIATPQTQGAFLFGLRLMAMDATVEDVPDSPANAAYFGRTGSHRGKAAFPQVRAVYLAECGTHAIVDAGFWPVQVGETVGAKRLLRSVTPGMLVMWDRGVHSYAMIYELRQRGAHLLGRLPSGVKPVFHRRLSDGSYLAYLRPSDARRRRAGERMLVRIVEYHITDPDLPGYGKTNRLVTTLLDPEEAPAFELACAYHERWEIEITIDEIDTHQRLAQRTLRSLTPVAVIQELYAMLIAHYAVRYLMHEAALQAELDPDRLSFTGALQVLKDAVSEFQMAAPEELPRLRERMLLDMAAERLPERRPRSNPRVVKRKMSKFPLKRARTPPSRSRPLREAIAMVVPVEAEAVI